jgi:uncharacterized protein DUF4112
VTDEGLRRLAWWLDEAFPIPGTQQRIGFDALIGLIPGIGDGIGALLSTYIILEGARRGATVWTVVRMLGNVAVDTALGTVPFLGDLFDGAFKANRRNLDLLSASLGRGATPRDPQRVLRLATAIIVAAVLALLVATLLLTLALYHAFFG